MSLFGGKEQCSICQENIGRHKLSDGFVCDDCLKQTSGYLRGFLFTSKRTKNDVLLAQNAAKHNASLLSQFSETTSVGDYLKIDRNNKLWMVPGIAGPKENPKVFHFDDIIDYELIADETSIKKSGLGSAVAGGLLFGNLGAIVGGAAGKKSLEAISSLKIRVSTKDEIFNSLIISLLNTKTKKGSFTYNITMDSAQKVVSALDMIESEKQSSSLDTSKTTSVADEILKLKQLVDAGALTEQEFQTQKDKVLSL